jgi:hypothetical protein
MIFIANHKIKTYFGVKKVIGCAHICKLFVYLSLEGVFFIK